MLANGICDYRHKSSMRTDVRRCAHIYECCRSAFEPGR
jgi:hypothetical protein